MKPQSANYRSMSQCNANTKEDGAADDYSEDFLADGAHVRLPVPNFDNKKIDGG